MSNVIPYADDELPAHAPSWRSVHRFWLELMRVYSADCARAGVDNLDQKDLRYERSYVASFMHQLINARTGAERERIIAEAQQFLAEQAQRARLEPPAPTKVVREVERLKLTRY